MSWSDYPEMVATLEAQPICPRCGLNWEGAEKDLRDFSPDNSENRYQNLLLIENCDVCRMRFRIERRL